MTLLSIGSCMRSSTLHEKYFGVCRCKCTFVDIGLNDGSSLMKWWRDPALDRLSQKQSRNLHKCRSRPRENCYYGFEANPRWSTRLSLYEQRLSRDYHVKLFVGTALSVSSTTNRTLYVETQGAGVDASLRVQKRNITKMRREDGIVTARSLSLTARVSCQKRCTQWMPRRSSHRL